MDLTFVNIILIVAASQSFLLSILVFQKLRALFANRFLALLMLIYMLILLNLLFQDTGVYREFPVLYIIVGIPLVAAPLHYLYTKYLLNRAAAFSRTDMLHFLLFGIFEIGIFVAMFFDLADFSDETIADPKTAPFLLRLFNWILIAQGIAYMSFSIRIIVRFNKHLKDVLSSSIEAIQMNWLRNITYAAMSAWILFFVEDLLLSQGINISSFVLVSVVFAVYVYAMGFIGLTKSEIFASPEIDRKIRQISEIDSIPESTGSKYEKSGLSAETAELYLSQLLEVMEREHPYIDPVLNLTQLAEMLSLTPHNLSEVINSLLKKNFYDFVNGYRIDRVKKDLADPAKMHLKILSVAFDAGFNSKATFNTLFKQHTRKTPSDYRKTFLTGASDSDK